LKILSKAFLTGAVLLFIGLVYSISSQLNTLTGILTVAFLLLLSIYFQKIESLKGYSFPVVIFGMVALGMFFPTYFQEYDGYKFSNLITPLIQLIMFGMGATLSLKDFAAVVKSPKSVGIGVLAQFSIMPMIGFGLAKFSGLEPEIAAGIILVGCSPSGTASNVMAFLAKANVALSVTLTSVTTLLAPLLTPLLVAPVLLPALLPPVAVLPLGEKEAAWDWLDARAPCRISLWRPRVCSSLGNISHRMPSRPPTMTRSTVAITVSRSQLKASRERRPLGSLTRCAASSWCTKGSR
jgi:hypothetical protein